MIFVVEVYPINKYSVGVIDRCNNDAWIAHGITAEKIEIFSVEEDQSRDFKQHLYGNEKTMTYAELFNSIQGFIERGLIQ